MKIKTYEKYNNINALNVYRSIYLFITQYNFMIAIQTKYLAPTNNRGTRIKAFTHTGQSITIGWDYSLENYANYKKAALTLIEIMEWSKDITGGSTKDGYTFTFNNSDPTN